MMNGRFAIVGWFLILALLAGCAPPLPIPELEVEAAVTPGLFPGEGQTLTYTYLIKNVGDNTAIVTFIDSKLGNVCGNLSFDLAPGATKTCNASYVTTSVDVAVGQVATTATAYAHATDGTNSSGPMSVSDGTTATFSAPPPSNSENYPEISLVITSSQSCYVKVNEIITYKYSITNTGYKAIEGPFTIVDDRMDQWECPYVDGWILDVGMTLDCTGYYKVRLWDVGSAISNLAHAEAMYEGQTLQSNETGLTMCFGGVIPQNPNQNPVPTAVTTPIHP